MLAGRSPSQTLLDLTALVTPLIAIVPTPVRTGDIPRSLSLSTGAVDCDVPCVPPTELPAIANGLLTFVVMTAVVVVTALVLTRVQGTLGPGVIAPASVAAAVTAGVVLWWSVDRDGFVGSAHVVAAATFLVLIGVVSGLAARRSVRPFGVIYLTVAIAIALDLVALSAVMLLRFAEIDLVRATGVPLVFVGEAIALGLFAVFWITQTVQNWNDVDPAALPVGSSARRAG